MAIPNERISRYTKQGRGAAAQHHQGQFPEPSGPRQVYERAQGLVRDNPGYSIMALFAAGLGLGLLIAAMSSKKRRPAAKLHDYLGEHALETIQGAVARFVPDAVGRFLSKRS